jgi:hypothetical protein
LGLGHGGSVLERFFVTGMFFGLPMAFAYARRDLEYAIGAHYMIHMIPFMIAQVTSL